MPSQQGQNPYRVLRLRTTATLREVVQRSQQLVSETMDTRKRLEYRRAAEEICRHPVRRAGNQFWEPPETCYEDKDLDAFCRHYGRRPVTVGALQQRKTRFVQEDCDWRRLILIAMPAIVAPASVDEFALLDVPESAPDLAMDPRELLD